MVAESNEKAVVVNVLAIEVIHEICGAKASGCTMPNSLHTSDVYISENYDDVPMAVTHEMGHLISGERNNAAAHLPSDMCPLDGKAAGDYMMCHWGSAANEITQTDIAFTCGFEAADCQLGK